MSLNVDWRGRLLACILYPGLAYGTVHFAYWLYRQGVDYETAFVSCVVVTHAFFGALVYRWWAFALPLAFYFIWSTQVPCGGEDLACVVLAVSGVIGALSVAGAAGVRWLIANWSNNPNWSTAQARDWWFGSSGASSRGRSHGADRSESGTREDRSTRRND